MKILTQIRFYLVIVLISFLTLSVKYMNQKDDLKNIQEELLKCQTDNGYIPGGDIQKAEMQRIIDSLHDENFTKSTELGRYELTLDWLKEENPKAHKQFENYLYTQTE